MMNYVYGNTTKFLQEETPRKTASQVVNILDRNSGRSPFQVSYFDAKIAQEKDILQSQRVKLRKLEDLKNRIESMDSFMDQIVVDEERFTIRKFRDSDTIRIDDEEYESLGDFIKKAEAEI